MLYPQIRLIRFSDVSVLNIWGNIAKGDARAAGVRPLAEPPGALPKKSILFLQDIRLMRISGFLPSDEKNNPAVNQVRYPQKNPWQPEGMTILLAFENIEETGTGSGENPRQVPCGTRTSRSIARARVKSSSAPLLFPIARFRIPRST